VLDSARAERGHAAQGRNRPLLRRRRLDQPRREDGSRGAPNATRALLKHMKEAVERHGGTVEKFIGDAVMAVFGIPMVHEDDALRACRAAIEMRETFPELGVEGRIGLTTGEVVTGTEERM